MFRIFRENGLISLILLVCTFTAAGCSSDSSTSIRNRATVRGTLTLPAAAEGKTVFVLVDTNFDGDNYYVVSYEGILDSGTTHEYTINEVPSGTYYVYAGVCLTGNCEQGPQTGDYLGFYGTGATPPANANAVVPSSGTVELNISLSVVD